MGAPNRTSVEGLECHDESGESKPCRLAVADPMSDRTPKLCEGHDHDLLADTGREGVMDDIVGWIGARLEA